MDKLCDRARRAIEPGSPPAGRLGGVVTRRLGRYRDPDDGLTDPLSILRGGPAAIAHIERSTGSRRSDIACIPPRPADRRASRCCRSIGCCTPNGSSTRTQIELVGASIGAWRMAALAQPEPLAALDRLQHAYVHEQRYPARPTPLEVSRACRRLAAAVLGDGDLEVRKGAALTIVTARARGPLAHAESKLAFGRAMLSNSLSRRRLAAYLERVVFQAGDASFLTEPFDEFGLVRVPIDAGNQHDALLASGTIPLVCAPVRDIGGAPHGRYWDGALVDYHLLLPYPRLRRGAECRGTRLDRPLPALQQPGDTRLARQASPLARASSSTSLARERAADRAVQLR